MPERPLWSVIRQRVAQARSFEILSFVTGALAAVLATLALIGGFYYIKVAMRVNQRLADGAFSNTVNVFGMPGVVSPGDALTAGQLIERLREGGYSPSPANPLGWYRVLPNALEIFPRDGEPGRVEFQHGAIQQIVSLADNTPRRHFDLGPFLIANVSPQRERRLLLRYPQIPPPVVHAVISVEDKRFFDHSGVDLFRIIKAAYVDLKEGRKEQGASTLTMQLARSMWLGPDKRWKRKFEELLIALHLENKLSKQQIFEDYANQVYLGTRGSSSIVGLGAAARAYFSKDVSQLDTAEAALLAGMIQRPAYFNPFRYPDRALERRNLVLLLMLQNGYLNPIQYRQALVEPLGLSPEDGGKVEARSFLSLMNDELQSRLGEDADEAHTVYTTLDPALEDAARDAVRNGMARIDRMVRRQARKSGPPQVALIALDPHTGEIRALVGGRDDAKSQVNHVLALRQPGSVFKPFVFAAALHSSLQRPGGDGFSPSTMLDDLPASISFANRIYRPENFHNEYRGRVTLKTALADSLNSATVQLAEEIGYERVLEVAQAAGLDGTMQPTPALALGAYESSPFSIAEAYTMFANQGVRVRPTTIAQVRSASGKVIYQAHPEGQPILDPRVAYLMDDMMQDVLQRGTGAVARSLGFDLPAAGKTGTTRDGWFVGFTTRLLCVVWVGFDDNRDLSMQASQSALPIWADFMRRAAALPRYADTEPFQAPPGVVEVRICADSGQIAGRYCPRPEFTPFIDGTQPREFCRMHGPPKRYVPVSSNAVDRLLPAAPVPKRAPGPVESPAPARVEAAPEAASPPPAAEPETLQAEPSQEEQPAEPASSDTAGPSGNSAPASQPDDDSTQAPAETPEQPQESPPAGR